MMRSAKTKFLGQAVIIAIDTSVSMGVRDVKPNRFEAAKRGASVIVRTLIGGGVPTMVGVVAFYGHSMPVVDLTDSVEAVERGLGSLQIQGRSTNLSEAVKDSYLLLKWAPAGYQKRIIVITDGDYNEGYDPEVIASLLRGDGIRVDVLLVTEPSSGKLGKLRALAEMTGGKVYVARSLEDVLKSASLIATQD